MPYLTDLAALLVERKGVAALGVTLIVDGQLVTGKMVPTAEYERCVRDQFTRTLTGKPLEADKADEIELKYAAKAAEYPDQDSFPVVFLREVSLGITPQQIRLPLLKVRAEAVSAFAFGEPA